MSMSIPHYTALPPARSGPCDMVVPPPCRHAPCHHRLQLQYGGTSSSGCAALCWCLVLHGSCSSAFVEGGCASKIRLACQTFWCSSSDIHQHLRRQLPYHALLLLHPYCTLPFRTSCSSRHQTLSGNLLDRHHNGPIAQSTWQQTSQSPIA